MGSMGERFRRRQADDETRRRMMQRITELRQWVVARTTAIAQEQAAARRPQVRVAMISLPLLGAGTADYPITWSSPLPGADYNVDVNGTMALIGRASGSVKPGSKTAAGCTITVTTSLSVSAGTQLVVVAAY